MQVVITGMILLGAAGYAGWRVFQTFRSQGDACCGCEMKKNCQKFGCSAEK
jgi:hypothetical protein